MRGKITVGTVWHLMPDAVNIYIGRSSKGKSPLGNPFVITGSTSRADVCKQYRLYINQRIKDNNQPIKKELNRIFKLVMKGKNVNLLCYCAHKGLECHGDEIKKIIDTAVDKKMASK